MYIFGSFTRRRQPEGATAAKRRSLETVPLNTANSPPIHNSPGKGSLQSSPGNVSPYLSTDEKFRCFLCKQTYAEPKVLPCLHTFCARCLQNVCRTNERGDGNTARKKDSSDTHSGSGSNNSGSAASGYESEQQVTDSDESFNFNFQLGETSKQGGFYTKIISGKNVSILVCPICRNENRIPGDGVLSLPPNFILEHRMEAATLNRSMCRILCDLCTSDASQAGTRCITCLVNMCQFCEEAHLRQRGTCHHAVAALHSAGAAATTPQLRRHAVCMVHPENELKLFCTTCSQVICRDCCLISHAGHTFEEVSKAAQLFIRAIREAVKRTKPVTGQTSVAIEKLNNIERRIQTKTNALHEEVDDFIDIYARAVEDHRKTLQSQVLKAREIKLQALRRKMVELERKGENALDAVQFAEEVLTEGTDVEVLRFASSLLRRLEWCSNLESLMEPKVSETVQLLRNEISAQNDESILIYGIISTQNVAPHYSILNSQGLRCIRVHKVNDLLLEVRDVDNHALCHGGENVTGYYRYCDAPNRPFPLQVEDKKNGTYIISLAPESVGNIQLAVLINGKPIKDSPFSTTARNLRPHNGKYHCCTFCSTGGNKEVECGCGSTMGGGYKGCGHGHEGHPGSRHWNCCGNTVQHSECIRANSTIYQFSL